MASYEYPQDREPEHELRDDSTPDHDWEYGDMPGVTANDPQDPDRRDVDDDLESLGDGDDNQPPPDDTDPTVGGEEEPDRGGALERLVSYGGQTKQLVQQTVADAVQDNPRASAMLTELVVEGMHYDTAVRQAADSIRTEGTDSLLDQATRTAIDKANTDNAAELHATGLELAQDVRRMDSLTLHITDAASFAAALEQIPTPEDAETQQKLNEQLTLAISNALAVASFTLREPAQAPDNKAQRIADSMGENSATIARELERIGMESNTIQAISQHAAAYQEGRHREWAIGFGMRLIGHSDTRLGVDRFTSQEQWHEALQYLQHLMYVAPDSQFTRLAGDNVLRDFRTALDEPDLTLLPSSGSLATDEHFYDLREDAASASRPMLYERHLEALRILRRGSEIPTAMSEASGRYGGRALEKLVLLADRSSGIIRRAVLAAAEVHPAAQSIATGYMVESGRPYEEALWEAARSVETNDGSLYQSVVKVVLEHNSTTHQNELEAAGLYFWEGLEEDLELRINNIPAFALALQQIETPATAEGRQSIAREFDQAIGVILGQASLVTLVRHKTIPHEIYDGDPPHEIDYLAQLDEPLDPRIVAAARDLSEHSAGMSQEFSRLGADNLARYLGQHATAVAEGHEVEWAMAWGLRLVGNSEWRMGVARYDTPEEWDDAYRFLNHLVDVAPDTELTRLIGDNILDDLHAALDEPDLTVLPTPGTIGGDEHHYEQRTQHAGDTRPLLYEARIRVRDILRRSDRDAL